MSTDIQFTADMAELRRKTNFAQNGMGAARTDLQTQLFRFEIDGSKATIFSSNKEAFCRTELKINPEEGSQATGSFAVLGDKIKKITEQEAEQVSFRYDGESLEVKVGFLTVNLETYDGSMLKTIENGVKDHLTQEGLATNRAVLVEALACAKSCTTQNSVRPDVTHAELRKGRLLSSDGRKIMIYTFTGFPPDAKLKVPASALPDVISALKNADTESVQIIEGQAYYFLKANKNEYTLGVRKIEREFPQMEDKISTNVQPTDQVAVDKHVFEAMLTGVAIGLPSEEVKVTLGVSGTGKDAYLEVTATNALGKKSFERANVGRKSADDLAFPLSFKHILDTLGVFKGDSVVDMFIVANLNLLMVQDKTDTREVLTVIPFRTDKQIEDERREANEAAEAKKKATPKGSDTESESAELAGAAVGGAETDIDL